MRGTNHSLKNASLIGLAWPIFVEQSLRVLIGTVDTFMVSHISDGAVAALGVAHQVVVLSIIIFSFIGIGSSVVITHHLGAADQPGAERIVRVAVAVNTWVGLLVSVFVALSAEQLLRLMQLPPSLLPYAKPFLTLMGGTLFLEAQNIAMAAALRAHRHTRTAMVATGLQNVINLLCNALLLFGLFGFPKLGVPGVAISGIVSRLLCFVILRSQLHRRTGVQLVMRDYFRLSLEPASRVLRIGLPAAGETLSYWLAIIVMTTFTSRLGETALSAWAYSRQLTVWVVLFANSIGQSTEILIGHMIGFGELDRAHRTLIRSLKKGFGVAAIVSIIVALASPYVFQMFTREVTILATAVTLQRLGVLLETGRVFNIVAVNGLRATGDARFPLLVSVCEIWAVCVPLAWLFSLKLGLGVAGVYMAMIVDEWLRGMVNLTRWRRRGWVANAKRSRELVAKQA